MNDQMNKTLFLGNLRQGRADWDVLLAQIPEDQLTVARTSGAWTIKDIIAHITWHERQMIGLLKGRTLTNASDLWLLPQDERNAAIYEENKDRPLREVLEEAPRVYQEMLELVATLSDEELHDPSHFEGMPSDWVPWQIIASNTFEHYQQHTPDIQSWIAKSAAKD